MVCIALFNLLGNGMRNHIVLVVHSGNGQVSCAELLLNLLCDVETFDLVVVGEVKGNITVIQRDSMPLYQLADLGKNGVMVGGFVFLPVQCSVTLFLLLSSLLGNGSCLIIVGGVAMILFSASLVLLFLDL